MAMYPDGQGWACVGARSPRRTPLGDHLPERERAPLARCLDWPRD